jgi:hypothetical protein
MAEGSYTPRQISSVLGALTRLGASLPEIWLRNCLVAAYACWDGFEPADWSQMLWALATSKVGAYDLGKRCACFGGKRCACFLSIAHM